MCRLLILFCLFWNASAFGASHGGGPVHVSGHTTKNGTYIPPHYRSAPDGNFGNNWSTKGNVNPYTGKEGTRVTPPHSAGHVSSGGSSGAFVGTAPSSQSSSSLPAPQVPAQIRTEGPTVSSESSHGEVGTAKISGPTEDPLIAYQKAEAAKGCPEAQYSLGVRYMNGNGVPKDVTKGKELILKAADQGSERARQKRSEFLQQEREAAAAQLDAASKGK